MGQTNRLAAAVAAMFLVAPLALPPAAAQTASGDEPELFNVTILVEGGPDVVRQLDGHEITLVFVGVGEDADTIRSVTGRLHLTPWLERAMQETDVLVDRSIMYLASISGPAPTIAVENMDLQQITLGRHHNDGGSVSAVEEPGTAWVSHQLVEWPVAWRASYRVGWTITLPRNRYCGIDFDHLPAECDGFDPNAITVGLDMPEPNAVPNASLAPELIELTPLPRPSYGTDAAVGDASAGVANETETGDTGLGATDNAVELTPGANGEETALTIPEPMPEPDPVPISVPISITLAFAATDQLRFFRSVRNMANLCAATLSFAGTDEPLPLTFVATGTPPTATATFIMLPTASPDLSNAQISLARIPSAFAPCPFEGAVFAVEDLAQDENGLFASIRLPAFEPQLTVIYDLSGERVGETQAESGESLVAFAELVSDTLQQRLGTRSIDYGRISDFFAWVPAGTAAPRLVSVSELDETGDGAPQPGQFLHTLTQSVQQTMQEYIADSPSGVYQSDIGDLLGEAAGGGRRSSIDEIQISQAIRICVSSYRWLARLETLALMPSRYGKRRIRISARRWLVVSLPSLRRRLTLALTMPNAPTILLSGGASQSRTIPSRPISCR